MILSPSDSKRIRCWSILFALIVLLSGVVFLFSPLGFVPVPWPDAPPFYLPWRDLIQWPPVWRMGNYAAFVPSLDQVNFGTMPGLTIVLGGISSLGLMHIFSPTVTLKLICLFALMSWAWMLWTWLIQLPLFRARPYFALIICLAALWDPTLRWVTLAVRPEAWVGLIWLYILKELWKTHVNSEPLSSKTLWIVSGSLALAAYFHFDAIALVPGVAMMLMPSPGERFLQVWFQRLVGVGLRTVLFLSPWLIYCLVNFKLFLEQIGAQFGRLAIPNWGFEDGLFSALFIEMGSPVNLPKFFRISRVAMWVMIFVMTGRILYEAVKTKMQGDPPWARPKSLFLLSFELGAGLVFWSSFYQWYSKPEAWYVGLCHFVFWPWLVVTIAALHEKTLEKSRLPSFLIFFSGLFALGAVSASIVQLKQMPPSYRWPVYDAWVDCIDQEIQSKVRSENPKIWQTFLPDVLVDLAVRHPNYDVTRVLDYQDLAERAWRFAQTTDAIILSSYVDDSRHDGMQEFTQYSGPYRPDYSHFYGYVPFGDRVLRELFPENWDTKICHFGNFWASVVTRRSSSRR